MVFFNAMLRPCIEGYLNFCLSTMTSLSKISFNTSSNSLSGALSIGLTIFIIIFPPFVLFFLKKFRYKLESTDFKKKFESLYDNVETHK
jgi:hypothetical protein